MNRRKVRQYTLGRELGHGTFGCVYDAYLEATPRVRVPVAIKKILVQSDDGVDATTIRETTVLRKLRHDRIVRMLDVFFWDDSVMIIMEKCECDLFIYMKNCPQFRVPVEKMNKFVRQLCEGVNFMHANGFLHRDIKPSNLLLTADGDLKIGDFGLARLYAESVPMTPRTCTLWYRAPEVLVGASFVPRQ